MNDTGLDTYLPRELVVMKRLARFRRHAIYRRFNGVIACLVAGAVLGMLFGFALGW